jgi:hypothetical protein
VTLGRSQVPDDPGARPNFFSQTNLPLRQPASMLAVLSPHLVLVGGFLGAGKTTLLLAAGAQLRAAGRSVGIILNDQGGELVDTRAAETAGFPAQEVTGGCFCCRFSEFAAAAERLASRDAPEIILAEPVGSCTDLSATILQPIKRFYGDRFRLAPLTVLVDPARAHALSAHDADPLLAYLFRKQIAEADFIRFSKADLHRDFPRLEGVNARPLSARTGTGISQWLDQVLNGGNAPGAHLLDIDYGRYAAAEAALGWLNCSCELVLKKSLTPATVIGPLLSRLDGQLTAAVIQIAHLKVFAQSATGYLKASVCQNGEQPSIEGRLDTPPAKRYALTLNLRACGAPETLTGIVRQALDELPGKIRNTHHQSFRPGSPVPEHRFQQVV